VFQSLGCTLYAMGFCKLPLFQLCVVSVSWMYVVCDVFLRVTVWCSLSTWRQRRISCYGRKYQNSNQLCVSISYMLLIVESLIALPTYICVLIVSLHWLRVPERIQYKKAVLAYNARHGTVPCYLDPFIRVADLSGRRHLHSNSYYSSGSIALLILFI